MKNLGNLNLLKALAFALLLAGCVAGEVGQDKEATSNKISEGAKDSPTANPRFSSALPVAGSSIPETTAAFTISAAIENLAAKSFSVEWFINSCSKEVESLNDTTPSFLFNPLDACAGVGTHAVKAEIRVSGTLVDTYIWTYVVTEVNPSLDRATESPAESPAILTVDVLDTSEIFTVNIVNPALKTYEVEWFRDATPLEIDVGGTPSLTVNPSTVGLGTFSISANLQTVGGATIHETMTWILSIVNPTISSELPSNSGTVDVVSDVGTANLDSDFSVVINPNGTNFDVVWRVNGGIVLTDNDNNTGSTLVRTNPSVIPATLGVGTHTVSASLTPTGVPASTFTSQVRTWTVRVEPRLTSATSIPAGNTIRAISGVALNASLVPSGAGGFNIVPDASASTTRGAKTDFCVTVTDFNGSNGGTTVTFTDDALNPIGVPTALTGNTICLDANSIASAHTFTLSSPTVGESRSIIATVVDNQTMNTLRSDLSAGSRTAKTWPISVDPLNTPPTISVETGAGGLAATPPNANLNQGTAQLFQVSIDDKDTLPDNFQITYQYQSTTLDGAANIFNTSVTSNDCFQLVGDGTAPTKYQCSLTVPSYNLSGSMPEQTVTVTAQVQDNDTLAVTNVIAGGPGVQTSNTISWSLDIKETTSAPVIANVITTGAANPASDTYIHTNAPNTTAINTMTENDTVYFNVAVNEPDRDNYSVTLSYQTNNTGAYTPFASVTPSEANPVVYSNDSNPRITSYAVVLPQDIITGAASGATKFKIEVTEAPSVIAALPVVEQIFNVTVNNFNPAPTFTTAPVPAPATNTTANVLEGFPYSIDSASVVDDTSAADGDNIAFNWQEDIDCTTPGFTDLTAGKTTLAKPATAPVLQWTPDIHGPAKFNDAETACIRLCVGDDGFGNDDDCSVLTAGPWNGSGTDFITVREAEKELIAGTGHNSAVLNTAEWVATDGTDVHRYVVTNSRVAGDDEVRITHTMFNKTTGVYSEGTSLTFRSDTTVNAAEVPYSFSIFGDLDDLFVAYLIDEQDFFASPTPVIRVRRINRGAMTLGDSIDINIVTNDIGRIIVHDDSFYLPIVDFADGNKISIIHMGKGDTSFDNNGTNITRDVMTSSSSSEVLGAIDEANNQLLIARKDTTSGNVDLRTFAISTSVASPSVTTPAAGTQLDVFPGLTMDKLDLAGPQTGNAFAYLVGIDTGVSQMKIYRADASDLGNPTTPAVIDASLAQLNTPDAVRIIAGNDGANHELFVATIDNNEAYLTKVTNETTTKVAFAAAPNNGRLNKTTGEARGSSHDHLDIFYIPDVDIGSDGNVAGENTNDIILYNFSTDTETKVILINADDMPNMAGREPYFK